MDAVIQILLVFLMSYHDKPYILNVCCEKLWIRLPADCMQILKLFQLLLLKNPNCLFYIDETIKNTIFKMLSKEEKVKVNDNIRKTFRFFFCLTPFSMTSIFGRDQDFQFLRYVLKIGEVISVFPGVICHKMHN